MHADRGKERETDSPFTHVKQMKCVSTSADACKKIEDQKFPVLLGHPLEINLMKTKTNQLTRSEPKFVHYSNQYHT